MATVVPENGYDGRNWRDDFQLRRHLQDQRKVVDIFGNDTMTIVGISV